MMGSEDGDICGTIIGALEERMKVANALDSPVATLFALALGLVFLGRGEGDTFRLEELVSNIVNSEKNLSLLYCGDSGSICAVCELDFCGLSIRKISNFVIIK